MRISTRRLFYRMRRGGVGFAEERAELLREPITSNDIVRQEIVPKLMNWKDRIHNIQLEYHTIRVGTDGQPLDRRVERVDWMYNSRRQLSYHHRVEEDGKTVSRIVEVLNRQSRFQAIYPPGASEYAKPAEIRPITETPIQFRDEITPMRGVWLPAIERWLPYMLMEVSFLVAEWHDVDGHSCLRIQLDVRDETSATWYLDPEFDYLPRMYTKGNEVFVVEEFRQVASGTSFPSKGRFIRNAAEGRPEERQQWQIDTVLVNQELQDGAFESPLASDGIFGKLFQNQVSDERFDIDVGSRENLRPRGNDVAPDNGRASGFSISDIWTGVAITSVVGLVIGCGAWSWRKRKKSGNTLDGHQPHTIHAA
ncbi:MAG: hypothetical protein ACKVT0_12605 [Planctomycetaceae bacterium]